MKAKKLLSIFLALIMIIGIVPVTVFAVDSDIVAENATSGTQYADLQAAIDAAGEGDIIRLLADVTYSDGSFVHIYKSLTLDLGEYTITNTAAGEKFRFSNDSSDPYWAYLKYSPSALMICPPKGTSVNVSIEATTGGIVATDSTRLAIYAGNLENDNYPSTLAINGGAYESAASSCVVVDNGVGYINGGSYKATGSTGIANGQPTYNDLVLNNTDDCNGSFVINGGKFYGFNPACMSINKHDHHDHDSICEGMTGVKESEGWFVVEKGSLVATVVCTVAKPSSVHGRCFASLQDAIDHADVCDKVVLLSDIVYDGTEASHVTINKDLVLDLGPYTLTSTTAGEAVLRICAPDENTEINVTIEATTGGIKTEASRLPIYSGHINTAKTNITINGGNYESAWARAVYQNNGVCTINGGSYKATGSTGTANGQPTYNDLVLDSYDGSEGEFVINDGRFYGFNPACMSINKHEHHDHDNVPAGMTGILGADGYFTLAEGKLIAMTECTAQYPSSVHSRCFASLEDAIDYVDVCDRVVVIADIEVTTAQIERAQANGTKLFKGAAADPTAPMFYHWNAEGELVKYYTPEDRTFVVTTDKTAYTYGETVTVTVALNGNDLAGAEWTLVYDETLFKHLTGDINGKKYTEKDLFANGEVLATYTFEVIGKADENTLISSFTVENTIAQTRIEAVEAFEYDSLVSPAEVTLLPPTYVVKVDLSGETTADYVAGKKLVIVYTNSDITSYKFAGKLMYDVSDKYSEEGYTKAFAIVVDAISEGTLADYEASVMTEYKAVSDAYVITKDSGYDLNNSADVELGDVIVVYGVFNGYASYFENNMDAVLKADVNHDGRVDAMDASMVVEEYNK